GTDGGGDERAFGVRRVPRDRGARRGGPLVGRVTDGRRQIADGDVAAEPREGANVADSERASRMQQRQATTAAREADGQRDDRESRGAADLEGLVDSPRLRHLRNRDGNESTETRFFRSSSSG